MRASARGNPGQPKTVSMQTGATATGAVGTTIHQEELTMYLARFSYDVLPSNRQKAVEFIRREAAAARESGLKANLLIPLTRGQDCAALQFEVELKSLDELDAFRQRGVGSEAGTENWMHAFSHILIAPPKVEILRVDGER